MQQYVQYLPIIITVVSGVIGIYLKLNDDERPIFQFVLLVLIVISGGVAGFLTYKKLQSDQNNRAYEAATNIAFDKPFDTAIFVVGINETETDANADKPDNGLTEDLFPSSTDGAATGRVEIIGPGIKAAQFVLTPCGDEMIVEEMRSDGSKERYFSDDFLEAETTIPACANGVRTGNRGDGTAGSSDTWIFDSVAGGSGHVININDGENAGIMLQAREPGTIAKIEVDRIGDISRYTAHIKTALTFQLKFYQNLNAPNPIGEGCQSVYIIPLEAKVMPTGTNSALVNIDVADRGAFIECEFNPI